MIHCWEYSKTMRRFSFSSASSHCLWRHVLWCFHFNPVHSCQSSQILCFLSGSAISLPQYVGRDEDRRLAAALHDQVQLARTLCYDVLTLYIVQASDTLWSAGYRHMGEHPADYGNLVRLYQWSYFVLHDECAAYARSDLALDLHLLPIRDLRQHVYFRLFC